MPTASLDEKLAQQDGQMVNIHKSALHDIEAKLEKDFPQIYFYTYATYKAFMLSGQYKQASGVLPILSQEAQLADKNKKERDEKSSELLLQAYGYIESYAKSKFAHQKNLERIEQYKKYKKTGNKILHGFLAFSGFSFILSQLNKGVAAKFKNYFHSVYSTVGGVVRLALDPFQFVLIGLIGIYDVVRALYHKNLSQRKTKLGVAVFNVMAAAAGIMVVFAFASNPLGIGIIWLATTLVALYKEHYVVSQLKNEIIEHRKNVDRSSILLLRLPRHRLLKRESHDPNFLDEKEQNDVRCDTNLSEKIILQKNEKLFQKKREVIFNLISIIGLVFCCAAVGFPPLAFVGTGIYLFGTIVNIIDKMTGNKLTRAIQKCWNKCVNGIAPEEESDAHVYPPGWDHGEQKSFASSTRAVFNGLLSCAKPVLSNVSDSPRSEERIRAKVEPAPQVLPEKGMSPRVILSEREESSKNLQRSL